MLKMAVMMLESHAGDLGESDANADDDPDGVYSIATPSQPCIEQSYDSHGGRPEGSHASSATPTTAFGRRARQTTAEPDRGWTRLRTRPLPPKGSLSKDIQACSTVAGLQKLTSQYRWVRDVGPRMHSAVGTETGGLQWMAGWRWHCLSFRV